MGYDANIVDGVRRLIHHAPITDTKAGIRREAPAAQKRGGVLKPMWQYQRTFVMEDEG